MLLQTINQHRRGGYILLLGLMVILSLGLFQVQSASAQEMGTIANAAHVNVRSGPGVGYSIVARVSRGAVLQLVGRNADTSWTEVIIAGNIRGWVNSRYVATSTAIGNLPANATTGAANGVVRASYLNVRSGPSAGFGVVATVSQTDAFNLIGRIFDNTWVQIQLANGMTGWVNASYITPNVNIGALPITGDVGGVAQAAPPANASPTGVVTTGRVNVRYGAGTWAGVITTVTQGQSVSLLGRNQYNSWLFIQAPNGYTGWINANYVLPNINTATLPVAG